MEGCCNPQCYEVDTKIVRKLYEDSTNTIRRFYENYTNFLRKLYELDEYGTKTIRKRYGVHTVVRKLYENDTKLTKWK